MTALKKALEALGIHGKIKAVKKFNRIHVTVNGCYFGIFDCEKNTFVD